MIFFDTETCGLHGPIVLIQWARDDDPIQLHSVWTEPIEDTIEIIESFCEEPDGIVGFNLSFDWFHICQLYTTLIQYLNWSQPPDPATYVDFEMKGRDGPCLKPKKALDIMLHARKGPYQSTMDRNDIKIKKVPTALAWEVAKELDARIPLKDVYFARKQNRKKRWQVEDIYDDLGDIIIDFKNIVLRFAPSSALKALAEDALNIDPDDILLFTEVDVDKKWRPVEYGYAPFAKAVGCDGSWHESWPDKIHVHISHWTYNTLARKYAAKDVKYTRKLYEYFGRPSTDDDDSVLACMVGAVRWRGFKIDINGIEKLKAKAQKFIDEMKFNFNAVAIVRRYLEEVMDETEKMVMRIDGKITTKAVVLEEIAKWTKQEVCNHCMGQGCHDCNDGLVDTSIEHPAAIRAQEILDARHAKKEIENYDKLLRAGRFHASFNVIGTLSSRMSGSDGLNAQGIKRAKEVRSCFPLSGNNLVLCGGDFAGFEVVLADAVYSDPILRQDLQSGKKIHGLFGIELFPGMTYEEILASKGAEDPWKDYYTRSKNGVFVMLYGGESYTLQNRVGITEKAADEGYQKWINKYKVWGQERKKYFDMFCSMRQPNGIGTRVEWYEPSDYIESMFGFKRYFTLENKICKTLFNLANDPPKHWNDIRIKVRRRDRDQTASGASRSALFAAAFALQASNMRAAANHVIQSSGAQITKMLQRRIWDLQPAGIYAWRVQPMNSHDEVMCPAAPECVDMISDIVNQLIEDLKPKVPLIEIEWDHHLKSWADK